MARTLKTLLNDTHTYFMLSGYPTAKEGLSRFALLKNTMVETVVAEDCSEFSIVLHKRIGENGHMAWARLSRDNYKEAKIYFDFLKEVVEETAEGGHLCEDMVEGMANRINTYVNKKLAKEAKAEQ